MPSIAVTILAMAVLLSLVSLLQPVAQRLKLPFTVVLAAVGVGIGGLMSLAAAGYVVGPAAETLRTLRTFNLSSDAFITLFLPVLLFETALAINVRRFMDDVAPILFLAVVAVVVSTFLVGVVLAQVTGVGLITCLVLSAILATTDPAAVIGIFRDIGAPRRLTMLVEGESLLNDAAAIALFGLLLGMLTGKEDASFWAGFIGFLELFIGGLIVGYIAGRLLCVAVLLLPTFPMAEITLTVTFAYASYIIAEQAFGVSGVVAVVTAALVVGSVGRTRISPDSWDALRHVWAQIGFWASCLIFLFAGMLVPPILAGFGWVQALHLAVLVGAALASRALVLFGLLPLLSAAGLAQVVSSRFKTVILWGGLRGALSLVLGLAVSENLDIGPADQRFITQLVTAYVLFTLFVNGPTLRPLISLLGLDRLSRIERAMRQRAMAISLTRIRENVATLARDYRIESDVAKRVETLYDERLSQLSYAGSKDPPLSADEALNVGLVILVTREEELYYQHFQEGIISQAIVEVLTRRTGRLHDAVRQRGKAGYEAEARRAIGYSGSLLRAIWLQQKIGLHRFLAARLSIRFEALIIHRMVLEELLGFTEQRLAPLLGQRCGEGLKTMLTLRMDLAGKSLAALRLRYPDFAPVLQHQYLGRAALRMEAADYDQMYAESLISQEILDDLQRDLDRRRRALDHPPALDLGMRVDEMVARLPLFDGLSDAERTRLGRLLKPRLALPDEVLVRRGDRGGSMYFIAAGTVEVQLPDGARVKLHDGEFFGELALLNREPRSATVRSVGYCQLLELMETDFRRTLEANPRVRAHILSVAEIRRATRRPYSAIG